MRAVEKVAAPAIWLLARATRFVCRLFGLGDDARSEVSEEEIRVLVAEAATSGALGRGEQLLVERVFRLGDLKVAELMTPRPEIAWLDLSLPAEEQMAVLAASPHARLPAARGELDRVEGIVRVRLPLAERVRAGVPSPDPTAGFVVKPTYVPETVGALAALERLGSAPSRMLLVLDEHGALQGLLTESDLVGRLALDIAPGLADEPRVERRADGALLVDGLLPLVDLKRLLGVDELPQESRGAFRTLAGFVLSRFGRMPSPGDRFEWGGWRFEVVDLDGRRIDKVLLTRPGAGETA
jgi:putative hemolysin